jgi:hypothetical protein
MKVSHKGNAKATTLASPLTPLDMTVNVADPTGYPDGIGGPFYIAVSKGQLIEEKILCSGRTGSLFTVWTDGIENGRGQDDTVAQDHPVNAPVEHVWTAKEAEEISEHINVADGAHGYPPKATLVTTTGAQVIHDKTLVDPIVTDPAVSGGTVVGSAISGGTITNATKITLDGVQEEAEFRAREIMLSTADPTPADGEDGAVWIKYV